MSFYQGQHQVLHVLSPQVYLQKAPVYKTDLSISNSRIFSQDQENKECIKALYASILCSDPHKSSSSHIAFV